MGYGGQARKPSPVLFGTDPGILIVISARQHHQPHREGFMRNDVNRQWLLTNRPLGMINDENFQWTEQPIPSPAEGQVLIRNLWLSFDPTQRPWMSMDTYVPMIPLGDVMRAISVGQV